MVAARRARSFFYHVGGSTGNRNHMQIDERIRRRQREADTQRLVRDYDALSPVFHIDEPTGRGPVFERLLDYLDPVFDGRLPPNGYVYGPFGCGKSAIVTALFAHLDRSATRSGDVIHTSTRQAPRMSPQFAYVDLRGETSEFAFYHSILDTLVDEPVPEHGISTDELHARLCERIERSRQGVVVAVDHVTDTDDDRIDDPLALFAELPDDVSWLAIGREPPDQLPLADRTAAEIEIERYRRQTLVDVLMTRASEGLARQALGHDPARQIADWANGNAHDALAVLFDASERADRKERTRLTESDVTGAIERFPDESVSLARVLALPANKQAVLRELVDLDPSNRSSVAATTQAIAAGSTIDLSSGTVKRFLYELAEAGIVERVRSEQPNRKGRPPSRIELRFPPAVFRRLYDLRT